MCEKEAAEVLALAKQRTGDLAIAEAWFRETPLPGFGGRTAEQLVNEGHHEAVIAYLHELDLGGFA